MDWLSIKGPATAHFHYGMGRLILGFSFTCRSFSFMKDVTVCGLRGRSTVVDIVTFRGFYYH